MKNYENLTWALYNAYGNRKKPGRISLFVDLERKNIYPVPRDVEHIDFSDRFSNLERLIPSHIDLEMQSNGIEKVVGVLTGVSGLEIKGGVRHSRQDLQEAHSRIWVFVKKGEIETGDIKEDKIIDTYSNE